MSIIVSREQEYKIAKILYRVCDACRGRVSRMHGQYRRRRR